MLITNANYRAKNDALSKQPVYVAELFFNKGKTGVDGTNDIYFSTCDVNDIVNFPYPSHWFPVLKANSIGSMSQQVDPINGVSTIGNLSLVVTDYKGMVSSIIKAADTAGHGLRRQRVSIFRMFKGMDWADRVLVRTMQVQDLKLSALNEYTISAADIQKRLKNTLFNPFVTTTGATIAASGAVTFAVPDARNFKLATSVKYGSSGFILVDSEIMRWTVAATTSFTIAAVDRGLFGTPAAAHAVNAKVSEVIYLNENPVTIALKLIESSGVAAANGAYDAYPAHWGCNMDSTNDVQEADWLQVGQLLAGLSAATPLPADGLQFEFVISKGIEGKKFIEDSILKILGAFGFVRGDGKYSIRAYNDIANAAKENCAVTLNVNNVVKWGYLNYNYQMLANQLWIDYDEEPKLSGKYIRSTLFIDAPSIKKWGDAPQLKYQVQGVPVDSIFISQLYQRFQRVLARYSRPPMQIPLTLMPMINKLEIGDLVRVTLPIRDLISGASLDRAFEILSTQLTPETGETVIQCIAQPERANYWFSGVGVVSSVTISPNVASIPTGGTQQLVARSFDASGMNIPTPAISWIATGNVTVDANGLVTAGAAGSGSVTAVVGTMQSNAAAITVTAAAMTGTVASVVASPSVVNFAIGMTQQAVALAFDVTGNQINNRVYNWVSSNAAIASVPAGPSAAAVITAVANGAANITATETISGLVSPACAVTVAVPVTPVYTPPAIADSAYKIGTKITSMGGVGGPHTIPNGYSFGTGDFWFDGNVTLPLGSTCMIYDTVRIFSLGIITINGTVNGVGGCTGYMGGIPGYPWIVPHSPPNPTQSGFVGNGGNGGGYNYPIPSLSPLASVGAPALYPATPNLNIIGTSIVGGSWAAVSGLPSILNGSMAAAGSIIGVGAYCSNSSYSGHGGISGAGLLLMARGIYVVTGQINLNGTDGETMTDDLTYFKGGGGGACGGSFVALAEKNMNGLSTMSILQSRINTLGGQGGGSWVHTIGATDPGIINATAGGQGAFIAQVIG